MVNKKTRAEMIIGNMLLQGEAEACLINWKNALAKYQKAHKLPDTKTKAAKLVRLRSEFEKLSWEFVRLTGNKQSVRDAMIWELGEHDNPPPPAPIQLKIGLSDRTISVAEYQENAELQALYLPLHIIVETNTTIEEIKQFLATNKKQINQLLHTRKPGTLEPLRVERDKAIQKYAKQGMAVDDIADEIDSEPKFKSLHDEEGISFAAVEKVIQRKAKHDR